MPRDERKELPLRGQESWTRRDIGLISTARLHCRRAPRTPGIYPLSLRVAFYSYECQKLLNRGRINHNQPCKIKITYFKTHCSENGKAVTTVAQTGRNAGRRRGGELCSGGRGQRTRQDTNASSELQKQPEPTADRKGIPGDVPGGETRARSSSSMVAG